MGAVGRAAGDPARKFRMITTEIISANVLRIIAPGKLTADDFRQIAPQVDSLISQYGKIRLLIDASRFNGWENIAAFEKHAGFIKDHQQRVERIAVIAVHDWQHWLIGAVRIFLHPEVRAYDRSHQSEALQWIVG
jgi:SpoIIAA-like